jgi:hypothetical protein
LDISRKTFLNTAYEHRIVEKINKQCHIKFVWVTAGRDIEKTRLIKRGAHRDKWKLNNWDSYTKAIQNLGPGKNLPEFYYFDNKNNETASFDQQIKDILKWIKK